MTAPQLVAQIQGQGTVSADNLNTYIQNCTNIAQLRSFIGLPGMCVFIDGNITPGDGGAGPFYWNATSIGPDNNSTVIVPQPGVPGAWVRLTIAQTSPINVLNIAALRNFDGGAATPIIYVEGYYTIADGGGGFFVYNPSDITSSDNGGTIIIDANNNRYYRETDGQAYSVLWFGAGTSQSAATNDADFSATLSAATAVGETVFVPSGTYNKITNLTSSLYWGTGVINATTVQYLNPFPNITMQAPIAAQMNGGQLAGLRNQLINGSFQVWQNGNYFAPVSTLARIADLWNFAFNGTVGTCAIIREPVPLITWTSNFFPQYCLRFQQTVSGSGNTFYDISNTIEGVGTLAGSVVTISFWAISNIGGTPSFTAIKTESYAGTGGSPSPSLFTVSPPIQINGTWTRYSVTTTLPSVDSFTLGTNGDDTINVIFTFPLNQIFDISITNVQLESGPIATPFENLPNALTLAMCQRYFQSSYEDGTPPGTIIAIGQVAYTSAGSSTFVSIPTPTPMRVPPVVTLYSPTTGAIGKWNNSGTDVTVSASSTGSKNQVIFISGSTSGVAVYGHYTLADPEI